MKTGVVVTAPRRPGRKRESLLQKVAAFGVVGLAATAVHLSVGWILLGRVSAVAANAAGFLAGLVVTYVGNYFLTFRSRQAHGPTVVRFLVVSVATLAISEWVLISLHSTGADERIGLVIAIVALPLLRFGLLARQVFVASEDPLPLVDWLAASGVWAASAGLGLLTLAVIAPIGFLDPASSLWVDSSGEIGAGFAPADFVAGPFESLLGDELNLVPAWFLTAFAAVGPSVVIVLRQLAIRSRITLLAGVAAAAAAAGLTYSTTAPLLSGQFIVILGMAGALRAGKASLRRTATMLLGVALATVVTMHTDVLLTSFVPVGGAFALGSFADRRRQRQLAGSSDSQNRNCQ